MGSVTYRDGIAIIQIIIFPMILAGAVRIWRRMGWNAAAHSWRFVVTLSLLRITGSIFTLLTISHESHSIVIGEAVCELIGIAPLLLTYVGLLGQIDTNHIISPKSLHGVAITGFVGLVLGIAGISMTDDTKGPFHANGVVMGAMGTFIAVFVIFTVQAVYLAIKMRSTVNRAQKKLFLAVGLSWPFLLVRLVYSSIGDFSNDARFAILTGDATIYLCMDVLEEIAAMALCVFFGLSALLQEEPKLVADYDFTSQMETTKV
ncbi:hypothetical protein N7474_003394 [Penicillium riverlandense]|uniref:uncharacterized protein n=1 Tax=Penicillium riverlandense TaxID=1903569 RepID=UPI0025465F87|nr:uncharacterized protein N7474_003394 [Penicillium riverlandense]KAJ5826256.1 hypothetical protein N7474_003394 [Penicillium riverlandense]